MIATSYRIGGILLLAIAALSACSSSPPTRFFTLDPVEPHERVQSHAAAPIKVTAVHIPTMLDRESMVRREHGHELQISSQERWGGDFGEMARRVLTQDLQSRLPEGCVVPAESPAPENARGLVVEILSFEPDESGNVALDADWALVQGSPAHPVLRRSVRLKQAGAASAATQAATMSQLLGELADNIATSVETFSSQQESHAH